MFRSILGDKTWQAIHVLARRTGKSFQKLASAAFADFLEKHKQPVGFKAALEASAPPKSKVSAPKKRADD